MDKENSLPSPLLPEEQRNFLELVQSIINDIVSSCTKNIPTNHEAAEEIMVKLKLIKSNMNAIVHQLNSAPFHRREYIHSYVNWIEARRESISHLQKIVKTMRDEKFLLNVSKLSSSIVTLTAGGIMLLGNEDSFSKGKVLTLASCGAALSTLFLELSLLRGNIMEAKKILNKDKECFLEFFPKLDHAKELENALYEILEIDIVKDIFVHVKDLVQKGMEIREKNEQLQFVETKIYDILTNFSSNTEQRVPEYVLAVFIVTLTTIFLLMLDKEKLLTFDCATIAAKGCLDVVRLTCYFTELSSLSNGVMKPMYKGITAMGMVVDSAIILLNVIEISKGSVCPQADKIAEVASRLEEETKIMETIFKDTQNILKKPFS